MFISAFRLNAFLAANVKISRLEIEEFYQSAHENPFSDKYRSGRFFTAMGGHWHPECFRCAVEGCDARLESVGFIEEEGKAFCKKCYEIEMAYSQDETINWPRV